MQLNDLEGVMGKLEIDKKKRNIRRGGTQFIPSQLCNFSSAFGKSVEWSLSSSAIDL